MKPGRGHDGELSSNLEIEGPSRCGTQSIHGGYSVLAFVSIMAVALRVGATGICEHPAEPAESYMPSIWRLWQVQLLLKDRRAARYLIKQHEFGGVSTKPTHFLVINGDRVQQVFGEEKVAPHLRPPRQQLIGKDEHGRWKTSLAKEYPAALNKALVRLLVQDRRCERSSNQGDVAFASCVAKLNARAASSEAQMGPDFAG